MLNLKPQEREFNIKPIGIKYICEFCNEGEMIYEQDRPVVVEAMDVTPSLYRHCCNKCGKIMQLPKIYPYIEWVEDDKKDNQ